MSEGSQSLGESLPAEISRVREMLVHCSEVGAKYPALAQGMGPLMFMMRRSLDEASKAMIEGDVVAMIRCYEELKGYKE